MRCDVDRLLTTLEGSTPEERRRSIVERVKQIVPADFGAYLDLKLANDNWHYDCITCVGTQAVAENWIRRAAGAESVSPWDPTDPPKDAVNRLQPGADIDAKDLEGAIYERHYVPFGLCRERRILVYHGDRFAGWIGVSRHLDAPPFDRREERRLRSATQRIVNLVVAEKQLRQDGELSGSGQVVLRPDGSVEAACETASGWLDADRREMIAHHVRRLDVDSRTPSVFVTHGLSARLLRLSGEGRLRYLCSLEATRSPRLSPRARLTARQRQIADLLVVGATGPEIASHLRIRTHTVREHIKAIYQRLGVASRVELTRAWGEA